MEHVMIVDDERGVLNFVQDALSGQGYRVTTYSGGRMALEGILKCVPNLLIADLLMPDMDGIAVICELRSQQSYEGLPILVLTAAEDEALLIMALEAGANDFLRKPFSTPELLARVRTHLRVGHLMKTLAGKVSELEEMEQLKQDLTSMLVHDMKNPLTTMLGTLQLLEQPEQHRQIILQHHLQVLHKSCKNLTHFVMTVLDVWAAEKRGFPLRKEGFDLSELIKEVIDEYLYLVPSTMNVHITSTMPSPPPEVCADRDVLKRVMVNLLDNAIKYSPANGEIAISAENCNNEVRISIKDNGPGIPHEFQKDLFQKYKILQARKQGIVGSTGLGLAYCKLAVEAHSGTIGVTSEPGQGSTFHFTLLTSK